MFLRTFGSQRPPNSYYNVSLFDIGRFLCPMCTENKVSKEVAKDETRGYEYEVLV
jgi:hypothetical protein